MCFYLRLYFLTQIFEKTKTQDEKNSKLKVKNSTNWKKIQENYSKMQNLSLKPEQKNQNSREKLKGLEVMPSSLFKSDVKK